jgi:CRP-like cAMP-binding protein
VTTTELRDLPILAGLSDRALERLRAFGEVQADPGQVLTREDDAGAGAFLILDGTVAVELRAGTFELGPGTVVGELALLVPDTARVARVRAASRLRCVPIPREDFVDLVENEPTFTLALLRELARRLAEVHSA